MNHYLRHSLSLNYVHIVTKCNTTYFNDINQVICFNNASVVDFLILLIYMTYTIPNVLFYYVLVTQLKPLIAIYIFYSHYIFYIIVYS